MKLPFFPLPTIFFPGETVPLHIFEDRYKQMVYDCQKEATTFGIPAYINRNMAYGIEVQLVKIVTTYKGGEMDVVCVARQVFKIRSFERQMEGKLYAGGDIKFLELEFEADEALKKEVHQKVRALYGLMGMSFSNPSPIPYNSYSFAHIIGLSLTQEHEVLKMAKEVERLRYLNEHLDRMTVLLKGTNATKTIAKNGHFKRFDPLDFKDFKTLRN